MERIVAYEGWLAPCAGDEQTTFDDLRHVRNALDDREAFVFGHVQWVHLVDTDDREQALSEQIPALRRVLGSWHDADHLQRTYLTGSVTDIRERLERLRSAGFDHVVLGPVTRDLAQVELLGDLLSGIGGNSGDRK